MITDDQLNYFEKCIDLPQLNGRGMCTQCNNYRHKSSLHSDLCPDCVMGNVVNLYGQTIVSALCEARVRLKEIEEDRKQPY